MSVCLVFKSQHIEFFISMVIFVEKKKINTKIINKFPSFFRFGDNSMRTWTFFIVFDKKVKVSELESFPLQCLRIRISYAMLMNELLMVYDHEKLSELTWNDRDVCIVCCWVCVYNLLVLLYVPLCVLFLFGFVWILWGFPIG